MERMKRECCGMQMMTHLACQTVLRLVKEESKNGV